MPVGHVFHRQIDNVFCKALSFRTFHQRTDGVVLRLLSPGANAASGFLGIRRWTDGPFFLYKERRTSSPSKAKVAGFPDGSGVGCP